MAEKLINGTYTELQDAIDSVLRAVHSIGIDTYIYGKRFISSRIGTRGSSGTHQLLNGSTQTSGNLRGKLPFILNSDITSDKFKKLKANPACNFADGTVNNDVLIAYGGHSNTVNDDDSKYGYIQYPKDAVEDANRNQSIKTCIWTAGKALGTFKQLCYSVDICQDITSGVAVYREYYTKHGWPCNVTGITDETKITDGNSYFIDIVSGERTEIPADSPLKSLGYPAYYSDVVEIGDYIYFLDTNFYINKVDKNTLALVSKSSSKYNTQYTLIKIGEQLKLAYPYYLYVYDVNMDTLTLTQKTITDYIDNVPNYIKYNNNITDLQIHNVGENYILYSTDKKFGLACSDLSDVAGTVIPELCQFNIPNYSSFRQLTDTVACLSAYSNDMTNDLTEDTSSILKVCMDNGQVFSIAEWETPFENTGNKEIRITIAD